MLHATLTGHIGNDPELKFTADAKPILRFNVASNYRERDQSGEWVDRVEWVRVTVMGPRAESLANILHKGMKITALGRLKARPWKANDDTIRAGLDILANEIEFLSPRGEGNGSQERPSGQPAKPRQPVAADSPLPF